MNEEREGDIDINIIYVHIAFEAGRCHTLCLPLFWSILDTSAYPDSWVGTRSAPVCFHAEKCLQIRETSKRQLCVFIYLSIYICIYIYAYIYICIYIAPKSSAVSPKSSTLFGIVSQIPNTVQQYLGNPTHCSAVSPKSRALLCSAASPKSQTLFSSVSEILDTVQQCLRHLGHCSATSPKPWTLFSSVSEILGNAQNILRYLGTADSKS